MTKIKVFDARQEEMLAFEEWAKANSVTLSFEEGVLNQASVHLAQGFDGISTKQIAKPEPEVYAILKEYGIRQIAQRTAGFDMFDGPLATENGIIITNTPEYSPASIAEFTVGNCLNVLRRLKNVEEKIEQQDFAHFPDIRGTTIRGKTVAVVGVGSIGSHTARLFHAFGAKVLGYDVTPRDDYRSFVDYQDCLEDALKNADIVTVHTPLDATTHHMFDYETFKQMKPGAVFLNNARGGVMNAKDLFKVLDEDHLFGAAIDVYEFEEPYVFSKHTHEVIEDKDFLRLIQDPKIIYTPHTAYYTDEAIHNMVTIAMDAALEVIQTGDAKHRTN